MRKQAVSIPVKLTDEDVSNAKRLADGRGADKEVYASTNRWTKEPGVYHFHGLLGEMAYAKHYKVDIDWSINALGDGGIDLIILGKSVNVKTTIYRPPILKINEFAEFTADLLALALRVSDDSIKLFGFTDFHDLSSKHYKKDFGHGERICLDCEDLSFDVFE